MLQSVFILLLQTEGAELEEEENVRMSPSSLHLCLCFSLLNAYSPFKTQFRKLLHCETFPDFPDRAICFLP